MLDAIRGRVRMTSRCRRWTAWRLRRCRRRTPRRWRRPRNRPATCPATATPASTSRPACRLRPCVSSILNAAAAPRTTSPYSSGALNSECFGPQNGIRHPARAVGILPGGDRAPRTGGRELHFLVADERRASSRRCGDPRRRARWWRAARCGIPCWSARCIRPSLGSRRPGPVTFMSRSRLRSQTAFDGVPVGHLERLRRPD